MYVYICIYIHSLCRGSIGIRGIILNSGESKGKGNGKLDVSCHYIGFIGAVVIISDAVGVAVVVVLVVAVATVIIVIFILILILRILILLLILIL